MDFADGDARPQRGCQCLQRHSQHAASADGIQHPENGNRKLLSPSYTVSEVPISIPGSYFGGPHSGITQFVFVDGHVQPVSNAADIDVLTALATRAGGENLDSANF